VHQQYSEKLDKDQKYKINLDLPCGVCVCARARVRAHCVGLRTTVFSEVDCKSRGMIAKLNKGSTLFVMHVHM
jgi:hypothetical protein